MRNTPIRETNVRPDFMVTLGLLPPYTLNDVKSAYRARAMESHPDRGGDAVEFVGIHEAYRQAMEYVQVIGDRRKWIAEQVEYYLRQQEVATEVARLGGRTEFEEVPGLKGYIGDFALLADRLRRIQLQNTSAGDEFLTLLMQPPRAPYLIELNLAGTRVTDEGLKVLTESELLRRLDLSRTKVTSRGFEFLVHSLPCLESVGVAGSEIGWLSRWRLSKLLRGRKAARRRWKLIVQNI